MEMFEKTLFIEDFAATQWLPALVIKTYKEHMQDVRQQNSWETSKRDFKCTHAM